MVLLITAVNFLGVEMNARILISLLFAKIALLAVFAALAAPSVQSKNLLPVTGNGLIGVLAGAAIFLWSWDGFMRIAIMASEVKDPRRTIPFAVVGGIAFAAVVFIVVATTALGVLGPEAMMGGGDTPLLNAGVKTLGRWGLWIVLAA